MAARDAPDRPTNSCLPACTYAASTFVQPPQGRTGAWREEGARGLCPVDSYQKYGTG